jgi:hypothetical protein
MAQEIKKGISKDDLFLIRKEKIQNEINSAKRILKRDVEPLKIADKFIHDTFELLKDGISERNPNLSETQIREKILELISFNKTIKLRKKEINKWQK